MFKNNLNWQMLGKMSNVSSKVMTTLSLNADDKICDLSGGWLRKLALAKALVTAPDILLLDEPTNHLDIKSVLWLESILKRLCWHYLIY